MDDRQKAERHLNDLIRGLESERDDELATIHNKYDESINFLKGALHLIDKIPDLIVPAFQPPEKVKVAVLDFPTDFPVDGLVGEKVNWAFDRLDTARIIEIHEEIKKVDPNPPSRGAVGTNINRKAKRGELEKVGEGQHDPYRRVKADTVQPHKPTAIHPVVTPPLVDAPATVLSPVVTWALKQVEQRGHVVDVIDREIFRGIEELGDQGQRINLIRRMERNDVKVTKALVGHRITKYLKYGILATVKHPTRFLKNHYRIDRRLTREITENSNADRQGERIPDAEEPATTPHF